MKTNNLNYAFNVEYYDDYNGIDRDEEVLKRKNRELTQIKSGGSKQQVESKYSFELQTAYPGLLIGIGNEHAAGEKSEIGLGFTFDYVTGTPYIPGSSIKGVLRSAFEHKDYIKDLLKKENIDVEDLKNEIFEGKKKTVGEKKYVDIPVPLRDTFYDSFPSTEGMLIALEAITPHKSITESPNPLTLVKVKPNVKFRFCFKLYDGLITADEKRELFRSIIKDLGLGAKTNVGFGVFTEVEREFIDTPTAPVSQQSNRPQQRNNNIGNAPSHKEGDIITCQKCGKAYTITSKDVQKEQDKGRPITWCLQCRRDNYNNRQR